ncbi:MAG: prepilin-type N-terminal cleavage/methylation domain-containing protein [Verrucomicrobia bacterium]|nr:prepilin-type N-terminal cleavage/methylation domain-containing protein [Verrucomicrobiota bacterium]
MRRRAAGFTLLEMIVVLVIAALIIGVGAGAVAQLTEENELRKVAHEAEGVFMQAMTRSLATTQPQSVSLEELGGQARLTLRRAGVEEFVPATGQRVLLRPGGLCEPLTLRWQKGAAWMSATLDPLTGGFAETEENL